MVKAVVDKRPSTDRIALCALGHDVVQALVKGAAEHGLQLLTKNFSVLGSFVRFKRFEIFPDFHQCEMIVPVVVLEQLETDDARIVPAIGRELLEELGAVLNVVRSEVNVSNYVEFVARSLGMRSSCERERKQCSEQNYQNAGCEFHVGSPP
jgi:hypothetical protein